MLDQHLYRKEFAKDEKASETNFEFVETEAGTLALVELSDARAQNLALRSRSQDPVPALQILKCFTTCASLLQN